MKALKLVRTLFMLGIASASICMLAACTNPESEGEAQEQTEGLTGGIAATVNGTEIAEDAITTKIQNMRTTYNLTDEDAWGEYLAQYSYTPEDLRKDVIDSYISEELTKQAISEKDIQIDDSQIDENINKMKERYDSDEAWTQALQGANLTEQSYRESIRLSLQKQQLKEVVAPITEPTKEETLEYLTMYMSAFDGAKKSSHILFESTDEKTAQEVLDKINAGQLDFAEAAKQYSKDSSAEKGGDVGWDKLTNFVTAYTEALGTLEKGQVSGLVTSEYGIHIIKCTDVFSAPAEVTDPSQVPSEFVDAINSMIENSNQSTAYTAWYEDYKAAADIVINDMPANVPYNVDMTKYQKEEEATDSGTGDGSATSNDGTASNGASPNGTSDTSGTGTDGQNTEGGGSQDTASGQQPAEAS